MGEKDMTEKHLEAYNDVFADIVNVLLFNAQNRVKPEDLAEVTVKSQYKADTGELHEEERDCAKYWSDSIIKVAAIGIENQTTVDNDMPLRTIAYDGASYRSQLLCGKKERYPVISIVLHFGDSKWYGAKKLSERVTVPQELKPYFNDYEIKVFDIPYLTPQQVSEFKSDFRIVADYFVQMRMNKKYVPSKDTIKHVDAVLKMMSVFTNDTRFNKILEKTDGREVSNMCEALDIAIAEGEAKGKMQAIIGAVKMLREVGLQDSEIKLKLMETYELSAEDADEFLS